MGTDDLDERLQYSMIMNLVLKYMKDTEESQKDEPVESRLSGIQKKEQVLQCIRNMPIVYGQYSLFIDVVIDTLVSVSNDPSLIQSVKRDLK